MKKFLYLAFLNILLATSLSAMQTDEVLTNKNIAHSYLNHKLIIKGKCRLDHSLWIDDEGRIIIDHNACIDIFSQNRDGFSFLANTTLYDITKKNLVFKDDTSTINIYGPVDLHFLENYNFNHGILNVSGRSVLTFSYATEPKPTIVIGKNFSLNLYKHAILNMEVDTTFKCSGEGIFYTTDVFSFLNQSEDTVPTLKKARLAPPEKTTYAQQ
jgi:hypothetical protein